VNDIAPFLSKAYVRATAQWDVDLVKESAALAAPSSLLHGPRSWLVRGDLHLLWARWFAEGVADPERFVDEDNPFPLVLEQVLQHMPNVLPEHTHPERGELADAIAQLIVAESSRRRGSPGRRAWTRLEKEELWDASGSAPRCWICGYRFTDPARDRFLGKGGEADASPTWVDFLRPQGVHANELRIEIDHVGSLGAGGDEEALRLACGWCNRHKSDRGLTYDTRGVMKWFDHPDLGRVGVPHPFWVVRALAMHGQCDELSGCGNSIRDSEMTVAPRRMQGAPNPVNLQVVCVDHDPLVGKRLVLREEYLDRLSRRR
jgi:hypothetical protein